MLQLSNVITGVSAATLLLTTEASVARAQVDGVRTGVVEATPLDASALGVTRPASAGLYAGDNEYVAVAGWGAVGGALHTYFGAARSRWSLGAGYARTLVSKPLAGPIAATVGGELQGGFRHVVSWAPGDAGAASLAIPLAITAGDPNGPSLSLYALPYAEAGIMRQRHFVPEPCVEYTCGNIVTDRPGLVHALGVGAGTRLALGRFSLELLLQDVVGRSFRTWGVGDGAIGFNLRLGGDQDR
jgi:hypothetical protein